MKRFVPAFCLVSLSTISLAVKASAQEISGFSTQSVVQVPSCTPKLRHYNIPQVIGGPRPILPPPCIGSNQPVYTPTLQPYADTEEDCTASLYYNVQSTSVLYYEGNQNYITGAIYTGNPKAVGGYSYANPISGVYTEVTGNYVDFFYLASAGDYYDPYGFSLTNGQPSEDDGSGFWFSVYVYGTYIAEASVLLGESYDSTNYSTNYQGPTAQTIAYQAFIPPNNVSGPPPGRNIRCVPTVYAGIIAQPQAGLRLSVRRLARTELCSKCPWG